MVITDIGTIDIIMDMENSEFRGYRLRVGLHESMLIKMKLKKAIILIAILSFSITGNIAAADKKKDEKPSGLGKVRIIRASELKEKEWTIESYRVDTGDVMDISVWQVEELHREVVVRPDGMISFPLIGDVFVAGCTLDEITENITEKLKIYIKHPQVSIIVKDFGGKKIVILGEVSGPGIIRFTEPIRILEALALSGGFQETAGLKSVLVIRGDLQNYTEVIVINVVDILKGNLGENIYIQKDDIVYVPRNFIGNVGYFVRQISPLLGAASTYYNIKRQYYSIKRKEYRTAD